MKNFLYDCFKPTKKKVFADIFFLFFWFGRSIIYIFAINTLIAHSIITSGTEFRIGLVPSIIITIINFIFYFFAAFVIVTIFQNKKFAFSNKKIVVFMAVILWCICYIIFYLRNTLLALFPYLSNGNPVFSDIVIFSVILITSYFFLCLVFYFISIFKNKS